MGDDVYSNIRQILGSVIGRTVVDITQHDREQFEETGQTFIQFHFDNGEHVRIYVGAEGFDHNCEEEKSG